MTIYQLREPCKRCGQTTGAITVANGQNVVRCLDGHYCYCAPRTETGQAQRSVTTIHNGIKPKQRARILLRASGRCEICGNAGNLHVGHVLSVDSGLAEGFTDHELNDDENLFACCEECNLGIGSEPLPLRLLVGLLRRRTQRLRQDNTEPQVGA